MLDSSALDSLVINLLLSEDAASKIICQQLAYGSTGSQVRNGISRPHLACLNDSLDTLIGESGPPSSLEMLPEEVDSIFVAGISVSASFSPSPLAAARLILIASLSPPSSSTRIELEAALSSDPTIVV